MKRLILCISMALVVAGLFSQPALAAEDTYPSKEIEWVLWSSPGGGSDTTARTVGIPLRKALDVPLVIINMTGGSGSRAMAYMQNKKADGYTLLFVTNTLLSTIERGLVDYEVEDFVPVFMLNHDPQTIAVSADSGIESLDDLISLGKERNIKWGLSHLGGNDHIAVNTFAKKTGIMYDPIVFQSGGEVMVGALSGVIDVFISNPSEIMGQIEAGEIRVIGSMSEERLSVLPDVPTVKEKGYDVVFGTWRGVTVKKDTDPAIVNKLEEYFASAADTEIFRNFLKNNGMDYAPKKSGEFANFIKSQHSVFAEGVHDLGLAQKK